MRATFNPLKELQLNYTQTNMVRYIEANRYLEHAMLNKEDLLSVFENSTKICGYLIDPDFVCHFLITYGRVFLRMLTSNIFRELRHHDGEYSAIQELEDQDQALPDRVHNMVFEKFNLYLEKDKPSIASDTEKVFDLFVPFKDYTITLEKLFHFIQNACTGWKKIHFNVFNVNSIFKRPFKSVTQSDFMKLEELLSTVTKTIPTVKKMSIHDFSFRAINQNLQDVREKLCVFCQQAYIKAENFEENTMNKLKHNAKEENILEADTVTMVPNERALREEFISIGNELMHRVPETRITFAFFDKDKEEMIQYIEGYHANERLCFNINDKNVVKLITKTNKKKTNQIKKPKKKDDKDDRTKK